jgi:hypothetical protein
MDLEQGGKNLPAFSLSHLDFAATKYQLKQR